MLSICGYETRKQLKAGIGHIPNMIETSMFGAEYKGDGKYCVVGPSLTVRKWYATVTVVNGLISKVE